jgi:hypothetical protein
MDESFESGSARTNVRDLAELFVAVMSKISFRGIPDDEVEAVDPAWADGEVGKSALVRELLDTAPWLEAGPAAASSEQHWIAAGRPPWAPQRSEIPNVAEFIPVEDLAEDATIRSPLSAGLHTSSASKDYSGMWESFLRLNSTRDLWRRPWSAWRLETPSSVKVAQVSSARTWAALVERHSLRANQFVYPHWKSIGDEFDAIHISPRAICAIEGLSIESSLGLIAPSYWSVESTLWFRWCFTSVTAVGELD